MGDGPRIRVLPEDFRVDEVPAYAPAGEGRHLFVHVEKRLRTTDEVASALARAAGVSVRQVGYAGRKDRAGVTRQWLSVEGLDADTARALGIPGVSVLDAIPHPHKLRTGHLRGNHFTLTVRDVPAELADRAAERLREMAERGMPNRYGAQRYGREERNVRRGQAILAGKRSPRDRRAARFEISALQAAVYDRVLADRPLALHEVEAGDVARVDATGGLFVVEDVAAESERAARFEISATGPIFGTRVIAPQGAVAEREAEAHAALGLPPPDAIRAPRGIRLRGARRPLRVRPLEPRIGPGPQPGSLVVACTLPAGSYATVLLEELFGRVEEGPVEGRVVDEAPAGA